MRTTGLVVCLLLAAWFVPAIANATGDAGPPATVAVVQSTHELAERLTPLPSLTFGTVEPRRIPIIRVDDAERFQRFVGVGGAMTDTSAWLIHDGLPASLRKALMNALFAPGGIHLGFIRVPIGASDFTAKKAPYSYDDVAPGKADPTLSRFSIAHDEAYVLPALRGALSLNPGAQLLATPWSPPAWMKSNDALDNPADTATLRPSDYRPLANYLVKFLEAYARDGVHVDAITPQNEPGQGTSYPGMNFPEPSEAHFVARYLEPAIRAAGLRTKLFGFDYGWSAQLPAYVPELVSGPARSALAGIAFHCYRGNPTVMDRLHEIAPAVQQLVSECSPRLDQHWFPAELEIASLRNWASIVSLWNLALDRAGGPVQPPNSGCQGCTPVVTVDPWTHRFSLTRSYYQLGQVSKFVQPGAVRIASNHFVEYSALEPVTPGLDDVAFLNPDGSEVLVTYNNSRLPITFAVQSHARFFSYKLPGEAMTTFVW